MRLCVINTAGERNIALSVRIGRGVFSKLMLCDDIANLNFSSFDHVLLTGFFPAVVTRGDIEIPGQVGRRDLTSAVQYKFVHRLPVDPGDVWWQYRVLNSCAKDGKYKIRAASVNKDEFAKQTAGLARNGIKIDQCIFTSLLICEEVFPGIGKSGPPDQKTFLAYVQKEKSEEYADFVRSLNGEIPESAALAFFALLSFIRASGEVDSVISCEGMIPADMRPERYRFLRKINLILMLFVIIFASTVLIERSSRSYTHYEMLERENSGLRKELKELQVRNLLLGAEEKLLSDYRELNAGYGKLEDIILEITHKIPSYMWVKSLRLSNNMLEMTLESGKDDVNFYNTMKGGKLYELKNLRKNKIRGENFDYTVLLELVKR